MTNEHAAKLAARITELHRAEQNQVAVEFEGTNPGFDLPHVAKRRELIAAINASGTHAYSNGCLVSRNELQAIRDTFNARVRDWMAEHPGQKVPAAALTEWQAEAGMPAAQIKAFVKLMGV